MAVAGTQFKAPDEVKDFSLDFSGVLNGAVIESVAWTVPAPLVLVAQEHTATVATASIGGGMLGSTYAVTATATDNNEAVHAKTIYITMQASAAVVPTFAEQLVLAKLQLRELLSNGIERYRVAEGQGGQEFYYRDVKTLQDTIDWLDKQVSKETGKRSAFGLAQVRR